MIDEIKEARRQKLAAVRVAGVDPYPESAKRTALIGDVLKDFVELERMGKIFFVCGRLRAVRGHGAIFFADLEDESGKIQILLVKDRFDDFSFFEKNLDIGDFLEISGKLFTTKAGEKTIEAQTAKMLAKSLSPLPEKWHGLKDVEERFRRRYLDLLMNRDVRRKFEARFLLVREIRNFLDRRGFLEVETPILQPVPGGAVARPFKTHLNALDLDLYLRIAPELYLKRLLVGGFERIYEIGRCFRNEGMDASHNPDFTMLELYWAYKNYNDLMELTEDMLAYLIKKIDPQSLNRTDSAPQGHLPKGDKPQVTDKSEIQNSEFRIEYQKEIIDVKPPYPRIAFMDLLKEFSGIDWEKSNYQGLIEAARELKLEIKDLKTRADVADEIFKKIVRPKIIKPTFIINHPLELSPLAKQNKKEPQTASRFQLVAAGMEIVNGFSELNDPEDQRRRFQEQEKVRAVGSEEAHRLDEDFLEALEFGMPPAAGLGLGIDRLVLLLTDCHSIREAILFPTMRPHSG